jgi:2-polyprenyl-6-methoxyphenol hydroxylase-like FAD-dependent oxidoreductase
MANNLGGHAIVIGGSIAGLMTARVLADYFDRVSVFERDQVEDQSDLRKSIPQGNHYHALLLGGQQVLSALYPGFIEKLCQLGAAPYRVGEEVVWYRSSGKSYMATAMVKRPHYLGWDSHSQSRGLIEHCIRQFTLAIENVSIEGGIAVQGILSDHGSVRGVSYKDAEGTKSLDADLVVDACGRGSRATRWLTEMGFRAPEETVIGIDFAYSSTKFRIPDYYNEPERLHIFFGPAPHYPNGAIMGEIEDHTWHLSLAGRFGDYPPDDEDGFFAFARSLYTPKLYSLIKDAQRIADIKHYRFPTSVQRHYERLTAFPERFLVLGDAICSFNPIYGQGMSASALQVEVLQRLLIRRAAESQGLGGLALAFFREAAKVLATPWALAAAQDLAYSKTTGSRPANMQESAHYFAGVSQLAAEDIDVRRLMTEVFQLVKPFSVLTEETLRSRVRAQRPRWANQ